MVCLLCVSGCCQDAEVRGKAPHWAHSAQSDWAETRLFGFRSPYQAVALGQTRQWRGSDRERYACSV